MVENNLAYKVIGISIEMHRKIGPGLLESAYENALAFDISEAGFNIRQQVPMPFRYKNVFLETGYRVDLLVEEKLIVEVKSLETLNPVHFAQTLTYLRLAELRLGLLINFNARLLKGNIHRIINGY